MTDKEILQSIIDNKGDCGIDNIFCVGCPLYTKIKFCKTYYFLNYEEDKQWCIDKLELSKKLILEMIV